MKVKEFKHETLIVKKEGWRFLQNYYRTSRGFQELKDEWLEKMWERAFKNGGANPKTHPISEDEIRIERDSFLMKIEEVKLLLSKNGFSYRQDGFIQEGMNI